MAGHMMGIEVTADGKQIHATDAVLQLLQSICWLPLQRNRTQEADCGIAEEEVGRTARRCSCLVTQFWTICGDGNNCKIGRRSNCCVRFGRMMFRVFAMARTHNALDSTIPTGWAFGILECVGNLDRRGSMTLQLV